jgi:hypothetical protein
MIAALIDDSKLELEAVLETNEMAVEVVSGCAMAHCNSRESQESIRQIARREGNACRLARASNPAPL